MRRQPFHSSKSSRVSRAAGSVVESLEGRRLMWAGSIDNTFGPFGNGQVNDDYMELNELPQAVAVRSDDRLVVGGLVQHFDDLNNTDFLVQAYTARGLNDNSFAPQHTEFNGGRDAATAVAIMPGGKVVLGGFAETGRLSNNLDFALVRYNVNGTPDNTFGNAGRVTVGFGVDDEVTGMAVVGDKVLLTGFSDGRFAAARFDSFGRLDTTFGNGTGKVVTSFPFASAGYALAMRPDGRFIVAGTVVGPDVTPDFAMVGYKEDGSLDTTFGRGGADGDGKVTTDVQPGDSYRNDVATAISILPSGKILLAGTSFSVQSGPNGDFRINQYALARYDEFGNANLTFGTGGNRTVTFGAGSHLAVDMTVLPGSGKILLAGSENLASLFLLTRLNADGSPNPSFNGGTDARVGYGFGGTENEGSAMAVQSDGKIVMVGPVETNPRFKHNVGMVRFTGEAPAAPPAISSIVVNGGAAQRSQVRSITVTFDRSVTLDRGAFQLKLLNTGGSGLNDGSAPTDVTPALRMSLATSPDGGRTWVVPVANNYTNLRAGAALQADDLADGIYTFVIDPTKVTAGGVPMGAAASLTFHRLFGDIQGSKTVNNADYLLFRNAFGKSSTDAGFDAAFDFDSNGAINNADFLQFRSRFGKALAF